MVLNVLKLIYITFNIFEFTLQSHEKFTSLNYLNMTPNNITKEHLEQAIEEINRDGIRKGRHSSTYNLIHNGKTYPPRLVLSIANRHANNSELDPKYFPEGKETEAFQLLENHGFIIVEKSKSNNYEIIREYISLLKSGKIIAANSIISLIEKNNFENNIKVIDQIFFDNKLSIIDSSNYTETIEFLKNQHKITSGKYNDFNIWSASKTHLKLRNQELIVRHDELNNKVGFPDNGNGLYKSFLGKKNFISYIKDKFENTTASANRYWLYAPGENAKYWDEFYDGGIMGIGWDKLGNLNSCGDSQAVKKQLIESYGYKNNPMNHSLANIEFRDKISIGDIIISKKGRKDYIGYGVVTSDYYYDSQVDSYTSRRKVDWKKKGIWNRDGDTIVLKTLTDITKYPDYVNDLIKLLGIEEGNNLQNTNTTDMAQSLNTIFYGPPGTGKTYKLSKELFPKYTDSIESKSREDLLVNLIEDYTWFEVISAAIHEKGALTVSEILNHELVQAKGMQASSKNKRATVWGQLQEHTDFDCDIVKRDKKARREPLVMWKNTDSTWSFHEEFDEDSIVRSIELLDKSQTVNEISTNPIKRFEFTTFHQSFSYEDFIEGIKPVMDEENNSELAYEIQDGIFKKISLKARNNPNQKYALFIDEINRGNVANIFGELITLIEPDKREGEENELSVLLPYSKKSFSVPKNLDIIGTMNTADRSVEALDTALRRRFSFIEMTPNSKVLADENIKCGKIDIPKLLDVINLRIEKLLDKDHCIGHSYFFKLNNDSSLKMLQQIFKDNIIPLLQEYFYGDFGKIGLVLGKAFVNESNTSNDVFHSDFSYEDRDLLLERRIYEFTDISKLSEEDFISIYA